MKKALVILLTFVLLASTLTACECKHEITEVPAKTATCTEDGATAGTYCTKCGEYIIKPEVIPAKGHTTVNVGAKDATCTEDGATAGTYCTKCGEYIIKPKVIPAKGHTIVNIEAKDATCTEDGTTAGTFCSVCNDYVEKPEVIVAKGHTVVDIPAKDVTCTEDGHTGGTECSVCHTVLSGSEIKAKGHQYAVTAETATCEKDGAKVFTCSVCGDSYEEAVKAFGHKNKTSVTKEATCSATGVRTTVCERCGKRTTETIEKKAHSFAAATCDKPKTCTVCGKTEGSALGHSYSSGKCTRCGKTAEAKIILPSVPQTINYKSSYSGSIFSTCKVTAISPSLSFSSSSGLWYEVTFTVTATYNSRGNNQSSDQKIGYKLYDSDNVVVKTGTCYTESAKVGETTRGTIDLYYLEPGKTYKLVLLDVN